jgi:tRNA G18 (ribose-2'-O)-methylase SpoU
MGGIPLSQFSHPPCAVYLLGSEANGLPPRVLAACQALVTIEAVRDLSYNVAVAGSIVMYQRVFAGHPDS